MGVTHNSVYQQIIERTRALSFRSSLLASNIEKREIELANRRAAAAAAVHESADGKHDKAGKKGGKGKNSQQQSQSSSQQQKRRHGEQRHDRIGLFHIKNDGNAKVSVYGVKSK